MRGCVLAAIIYGFSSLGLISQTVDIADFLLLDPGNQWVMEGDASLTYMGTTYNPEVGINLDTSAGGVFHGVQTTRMFLQGAGSVFIIIYNVEFVLTQDLRLSLDPTGLYLHSRVGEVYALGSLEDYDEEVYNTPARLLPRLITVGQYYSFTADLDSGSVDDRVYVEAIEPVETSLGTIDAIKLVLFSDAEVPVILWLGRNVGVMKTAVMTTFDGNPLTMNAILTGMNLPWDVSPIDGLWSKTLAEVDGWRSADWFELFWVPSIDSPWIFHEGFQWAFCVGDASSLWMYLQGLGWLWTNEDAFPAMWDGSAGKFLYYIYEPGSYLFYDLEAGTYIDLTP